MVNNKKKAFTLAELLVAMFIFAMIASMLIPNVTQNAEKNLFVTQLKKVQNDIQQALLVIMSENQGTLQAFCLGADANTCFIDGIAEKLETKVLYSQDDVRPNCGNPNNKEKDACTQVKEYNDREPVLLNKSTPANFIPDGCKVANLANGASVSAVFTPNCNVSNYSIAEIDIDIDAVEYSVCGYMEVDTNASKAPNMVGKDIHYFWIVDKDGLVPFGEIENDNALSCGNDKTLNLGATEADYIMPNKDSSAAEQLGCTSKLLQDGRILYY